MRTTRLGTLLPGLASVLFAARAGAQCAMCRASLINSQGGGELIEGLRQGIVLLLVIPMVIAGFVIFRFRQAARHNKTPNFPAPEREPLRYRQ